MLSDGKFLYRAVALLAVLLGVWTLSAAPAIAAPCGLVCFDGTLDAKKCRCVKDPQLHAVYSLRPGMCA
jgi:hypothetical protein